MTPASMAITSSIRSRGSGTVAVWRIPNLGYKPRHKEGYFPVPPMDSQQDLRTEMVLMMQQVGLEDRMPAP